MHFTIYESDMTITFPHWRDGSTDPFAPIRVAKYDDGGRMIESYQVQPDRTDDNGGVPVGLLSGTDQSHYVTWSKNNYDGDGMLESVDRYHDIPSSGDGTLSTNFYRTIRQYDDMGRVEYTIQVVSGTSHTNGVEQINKTEYDLLGRAIISKTAVSDSSHSMGSSYTTYPTLAKVSEMEYDSNGVGDGRVTKSKRWHGTGANDYTGANSHHDWRGRLRGTEPFHYASGETANGPFSVQDYDWRGMVVASAVYDTNPTWSTVVDDDDYADSIATNRRALSTTAYDDLGRAYESLQYTINSSTGAKGNTFKTEMYYDRNGRQVASEQINGVASEMAYDGAGRQYQSRVVLELEATKYSSGAFQYRAPVPEPDYADLTGGDDKVITLSHSTFDAGGRVTEQYSLENHHNDTDGIDLTNDDDYIGQYVYSWYDNASRLIDVANYGTNNSGDDFEYAAAPTRPSNAPSPSDTVLVTQYTYDTDTGRLSEVSDPAEIETNTYYDDLGRQVYVVENEDNFNASTEANTGDGTDTSKDRVTKFEYNGLNQITERTALDADGNGNLSDNQATTYLYEDDYHASLNTNIIYPDSSDTTSSGTDQVKMAYHLDGSLNTKTDQNDTIITYTYTNDRMLEMQDVTTLSTADGHVRAIKTAYDDLDRPTTVTSYATSGGSGTVRNQFKLTYNDLGQVTESEQSHEGAVSGSTPSVQYSYDLSADGNSVYDDGARLSSVTYPGGEVINYDYNTSGSVDDLLSKMRTIRNGSSADRVEYLYNGIGRMVRADSVVPDLRLMYDGDDSDGDYEGFDRFGRIIDQHWRDYGASSDPDRFQYDHDRIGNPDYRDIPTATYATNDKDQAFTYDGLHRLATFDTGTLSGSTISGTPATEQDFTLDQLGNWTGFVEKASGSATLNQTRTGNDANEITNITESTGPSWVTPAYDDNGNMTQGPAPGSETTNHKYIYDAWNRLVEVTDNSDVTIARYEYDGLNRRIVKDDELANPDVDYDYFYNETWQIVEVRKDDDTDPLIEMVYHEHYIDAPAYRYYDANTDGTSDEQYFSFDANFNVTALYDDTGTVLERYEYDAYGRATILDADFSDDGDGVTDYDQHHLFAGYRLDTESGLYEVRNRMLHPSLGRWMQRDPLGYVDGMNLYEYVKSSSVALLDPAGLSPQDLPAHLQRQICRLGEVLYTMTPESCTITTWKKCLGVPYWKKTSPGIRWCEKRYTCKFDLASRTLGWVRDTTYKSCGPCVTPGTAAPAKTPNKTVPRTKPLTACEQFVRSPSPTQADCQACCQELFGGTPGPASNKKGGIDPADPLTHCKLACTEID